MDHTHKALAFAWQAILLVFGLSALGTSEHWVILLTCARQRTLKAMLG